MKQTYVVNLTIPVVVLFCIFLVLKLTGVVAWSWWIITAPLWIFHAVIIGFFLFVVVIFGIAAVTQLITGR